MLPAFSTLSEGMGIQKGILVTVRRARIYDIIALLTALIVVVIDQWTKALVVDYLSPAGEGRIVPVIGPYLDLYYISNRGAAFSLFDTNGLVLGVLITIAIIVIVYLYFRMLNSGTWLYKLIFGLIIGGATGNLLDRFLRGYVVDFIWFHIPNRFSFAVFNLADSAISVGVFLLFVALLFGGLRSKPEVKPEGQPKTAKATESAKTVPSQAREHDV